MGLSYFMSDFLIFKIVFMVIMNLFLFSKRRVAHEIHEGNEGNEDNSCFKYGNEEYTKHDF